MLIGCTTVSACVSLDSVFSSKLSLEGGTLCLIGYWVVGVLVICDESMVYNNWWYWYWSENDVCPEPCRVYFVAGKLSLKFHF